MATKNDAMRTFDDNKPGVLRAREIQDHIGALGRRDLQLFSLAMFLLVIMATGVMAVAYSNLISSYRPQQNNVQLLPQLFLGLITLIILFSLYIVLQKKDLGMTRQRLVEELIFHKRMEAVSTIDPTTQLFNRSAMEQIVAHEVARATRLGSPLSFLILDISEFEKISSRLGIQETERFLYDSAQLVRTTFRASDLVFRYKETQFLVVMPQTNEQQVDLALERLESELNRHNSEFRCQAELAFTHGVAEFVQGSRIADALVAAERKAFLNKYSFAFS